MMITETAEDDVATGCGYEAPFFGAHYPDGICIDGLMWDLDSCDEPGGGLSSGGDVPCPACNTEQYLRRAKEDGESTVSWSDGFSHGTGEDIWKGSCARALEANPDGAQVIIDALGPFIPASEDKP